MRINLSKPVLTQGKIELDGTVFDMDGTLMLRVFREQW